MPSKGADMDAASEALDRDALLLKLLKTPPQPRPKRERGEKPSPKRDKESSPSRRSPMRRAVAAQRSFMELTMALVNSLVFEEPPDQTQCLR